MIADGEPERRTTSRRQTDETFEGLDRRMDWLDNRMTTLEQGHDSQLRIDLLGTDARPGGVIGQVMGKLEEQRLSIVQLTADAKATAKEQKGDMKSLYIRAWAVLAALVLMLIGVTGDLISRLVLR